MTDSQTSRSRRERPAAPSGARKCARQQHVNSAVAIDELGDTHVGRDAAQPIGVVECQAIMGLEQLNHGPHGRAGSVIQTLIEAHGHEVVGRHGKRQLDLQVPPQRQHHAALQAGFDRRLVHLAVPLRRMSVAHAEQRALYPYRQEQASTWQQLLVVEIRRRTCLGAGCPRDPTRAAARHPYDQRKDGWEAGCPAPPRPGRFSDRSG